MPEGTRLLCARHPHLGLVAALRRHPELRGEPCVVGSAPELRLPVLAASAAAVAAGVLPGRPLRQARQLCPEAAFVAVDEAATGQLRAAVAAALGALSPAVEVGAEETLCDLSGSHAAFAGEGLWASAVGRALMDVLDGELPAIGVGATRFVARMAALASRPRHVRRVPEGGESAFLAPLPLALLPIDPAVTGRLAALGLDCIGAVANLSPAELQRQFGPEGLVVHRHCHGDDSTDLVTARDPRRASERVVLDGAVGDLEVLRFAAHRCAADLGERLRDRGAAAVAVTLVLELEEAPPVRVETQPPLPAGNGDELWTAVLGLLGETHPAAPVGAVRVEAELRSAPARQADLWRGGDAEREQVLAAALRLQRRYGEAALARPRLAQDPGDIPERRFRWAEPAPPRAVTVTGARGASERGGPVAPRSDAIPAARPSTQPAQTGRVPWSRRQQARPPGRGHPRPLPAAVGAPLLHEGSGRAPG